MLNVLVAEIRPLPRLDKSIDQTTKRKARGSGRQGLRSSKKKKSAQVPDSVYIPGPVMYIFFRQKFSSGLTSF
jgi:hypothetical protein